MLAVLLTEVAGLFRFFHTRSVADEPIDALKVLILDMFSEPEFRSWLRSGSHGDLISEAASETTPYATFIESVLLALQRRRGLNTKFFNILKRARPRRRSEIDAVAGLANATKSITRVPAHSATGIPQRAAERTRRSQPEMGRVDEIATRATFEYRGTSKDIHSAKRGEDLKATPIPYSYEFSGMKMSIDDKSVEFTGLIRIYNEKGEYLGEAPMSGHGTFHDGIANLVYSAYLANQPKKWSGVMVLRFPEFGDPFGYWMAYDPVIPQTFTIGMLELTSV